MSTGGILYGDIWVDAVGAGELGVGHGVIMICDGGNNNQSYPCDIMHNMHVGGGGRDAGGGL